MPGADVLWIHDRLLKRFGPRGWWPVTPPPGCPPKAGPFGPEPGGGVTQRRSVYSTQWTRGRLTPAQQFEVAVGAILTQNTAWTNVEKALGKLIAAKALSPRRLASLPPARLRGLIRSSGYFRQKAGRLRNFCRFLLDRWGGRLDRFLARPTETARGELLALNGVGPETADSILLYAGGHPVFVVDAYTRRFGGRFGLFRTDDYHEVQRHFMSRMKASVPRFREYHALLVELAKRFCRARPLCPPCPLRARCATGRSQT